MARRDIIHDAVCLALERQGWIITDCCRYRRSNNSIMEKIGHYKEIIEKELEYRQTIKIANAPELSRHLIIDKDGMVFLLIDVGWF